MEKYRFPENELRLLEGSPVPLAVYQFLNKRVVTLALSDGFCRLFGYTDRAVAYDDMDNDMYKDTHPDDAARIADAAYRFATEGGRYEVIYRSRVEERWRIVHAMGEHVHTDTGVRLAYVWYTDEGSYQEGDAENTGRVNQELGQALRRESILHANSYDYLTGLPTMHYFFELADEGLRALWEAGESPVVLFMDLNGMKLYNRRHGFGEGDRLLRDFSQLLVRHFSNENCCRTGEDHFAVFTREKGIEETLDSIFREWRDVSSLPVRVGVYPERMGKADIGTACDRAKFACDTLRSSLVSGFRYYDAQLQRNAAQRMYIVDHLDKALAEGWIQVYYQPIVRATSDLVCNEEALARWINPAGGSLTPGEFIPPLEDAGLVYKLDLYVVEQVLKKLRSFANSGMQPVPQSINLSRSDFDACDVVEEIRRRVDEAGVDRRMLSIEITESMVGSDFSFMKEQMERFRALGFSVWMDDFGSGYSSLDLLQSVKFDLIKFDMHFMQQLERGGNGRIILTELMKMISALGIDAVCEGVETEEQARFLREIGCSKLQGFYFSRPIPLEGILELMKNRGSLRLEDPREAGYYDLVGKVNLFDLGTLAYKGDRPIRNVFNTLPMAILEIRGEEFRFLRMNQSFREYLTSCFGLEDVERRKLFTDVKEHSGKEFRKVVQHCCETKGLAVFDGLLDDGSIAHYIFRYLEDNPLTGTHALAAAVLSIKADEHLDPVQHENG